jgi:hypothetical protein
VLRARGGVVGDAVEAVELRLEDGAHEVLPAAGAQRRLAEASQAMGGLPRRS